MQRSETTNQDRLVTAEAVARYFHVSPSAIHRWVHDGTIPFVRASRRIVRFRIADVERALTHRAATSTAEVQPTTALIAERSR